MPHLEKMLGGVSDFLWGYPLIILLFGTHLYLSLRLKFMPQRRLFEAVRISLQKGAEGEGDVSRFGALTTAFSYCSGDNR